MRIVVRAPNWVGDAVMALPALGDLIASFPDAEIDGFATAASRQVLEGAGLRLRLHSLARSRVRMFRQTVVALRRERFALGLVFPPSFSSALILQLGGVRTRVGYRGHGRARLLTHALDDVPRGEMHLSSELRAVVAAGALAVGAQPRVGSGAARLAPAAEAMERAEALLGREPGRVVVMAPGAVYGATKRWPARYFAALAERLSTDHGARVVLTGAAADVPTCREVAERAATRPLDLSGRTSIGTLVAIFASSSLVVSNDSGAMHLAAAAGARVVAIFGSTSPRWTAPLGERSRVLWREEPCAPCFRRRCPIGIVCLTRLEVDEVMDACRDMMNARAPA